MKRKRATADMASKTGAARTEADKPLRWPEAIARLASERTRAVNCAARARALGDAGAALAAAYGEAKAEMDGVIAGLSVGLTEGRATAALDGLQQQLEDAVAKREAFCQAVREHSGPGPTGERGIVGAALVAAVKPLVEAFVALVRMVDERDRRRRDTIRAELKATRWPDFADIDPAG